MAERRARHLARAAEAAANTTRAWHAARARGLARKVSEAVSQCGIGTWAVECGCDDVTLVPRRCARRVVCPVCSVHRARVIKRRVRMTVERRMARAHEAWAARGAPPGRKPKMYMITLTLPHEEERGRLEVLIDETWRQLRKHAARSHWSRDTLAVLEWTPGRDGRGHPHLHVLAISTWIDYGEVREHWRAAARRAGAKVPYGRGIDIETYKGGQKNAGRDAAKYVAKYVTSTDKVGLYSVEDWARLCAWQVGRRTLRATRGWWDYDPAACPCCGQRAMWRGVAGSAWTSGDVAGRPGGSAARRQWAVRLYYDPLTGWCRSWVDNGAEEDAMYGAMSMVESSFPLGDCEIYDGEKERRELDMAKYREDAYIARVKWAGHKK